MQDKYGRVYFPENGERDELKLKNWMRLSTDGMMYALELMRFISETAMANDRFRIVVEYDPEAMKSIVSVWTKDGERSDWECPALPQLVHPKAKEP